MDAGHVDFCAAQVRRHDHDRYLCALFAPRAARPALFALYAFNLEIARIRESVSEAMLGEIRLQWWREAIESIDTETPRDHAVVQALAAARGLSHARLKAIMDARAFDLEDRPPEDMAALEAYAAGTSAELFALTLEALGVDDPAAALAARHVGIAWALTGLIRAVGFHGRARRLYLPADLAVKAGLHSEDVFAGRDTPALHAVVGQVADAARAHLSDARADAKSVPRRALPALLPGVLATAYLARIDRADNNPFDPRLAIGPLPRQLRLALAAALGRY